MNPGRGPMQKTGRGIPQAFQSPLNQAKKKDVMSGDQLPSYTENTTTSKNSGSGSGTTVKSMTQSKESASGSSSKKKKSLPGYDKAYDAQSDAKKAGQTREQFKEAAIAYNAKKKADSKNPSSSSSSSAPASSSKKKSSSSTSSTTRSKTTSLGTQTKNQVKAKGKEKVVNARDKRNAEKQAAIIRAKSDSTNTSNRLRKTVTKDGKIPLDKVKAKKITAAANASGRNSLRGALGKDGATKAFPTYDTSKNVKNTIEKRSGTEGGVFTGEDFE